MEAPAAPFTTLDALDVFGIDVGAVAVEQHAVDDDERALIAARRVDRVRAAQHDRRCRARTAVGADDRRAGDLAGDRRERARRLHLEILLGVERGDGERRLLLFRRAGHAGDDDFLQAIDVALELEVERLRAGAERDLLRLREVADRANAQHDGLSANAFGRHRDGVTALRVRADGDVQLRDVRVRVFERLA